MDTIQEKIKNWEAVLNHAVNVEQPVVCRIDGHRFSRFSKVFNRPFDIRLHQCMVNTSNDLMQYFPHCKVAYTQSDEISLFFLSLTEFNGRVQKLVSLTASYASVRFDYHFSQIAPDLHSLHGGKAHFDSRVFNVLDVKSLYQVFEWRTMDAQRNAKLLFGHQHLKRNVLHKMSTYKIVTKLNEMGIDYYQQVPLWAQMGTMLYREKVIKTAVNQKTLVEAEFERMKIKIEDKIMTKDDFISIFQTVIEK